MRANPEMQALVLRQFARGDREFESVRRRTPAQIAEMNWDTFGQSDADKPEDVPADQG